MGYRLFFWMKIVGVGVGSDGELVESDEVGWYDGD